MTSAAIICHNCVAIAVCIRREKIVISNEDREQLYNCTELLLPTIWFNQLFKSPSSSGLYSENCHPTGTGYGWHFHFFFTQSLATVALTGRDFPVTDKLYIHERACTSDWTFFRTQTKMKPWWQMLRCRFFTMHKNSEVMFHQFNRHTSFKLKYSESLAAEVGFALVQDLKKKEKKGNKSVQCSNSLTGLLNLLDFQNKTQQ